MCCLDHAERSKWSLRKHDERARVFEHEIESFFGIREVERNVRATRLENPDKGCDHLERPVDAATHHRLRSHAHPAQPMRHAIRTNVQFGIREPFFSKLDRDGIGLRGCHFLEELRHGLFARIGRLGRHSSGGPIQAAPIHARRVRQSLLRFGVPISLECSRQPGCADRRYGRRISFSPNSLSAVIPRDLQVSIKRFD